MFQYHFFMHFGIVLILNQGKQMLASIRYDDFIRFHCKTYTYHSEMGKNQAKVTFYLFTIATPRIFFVPILNDFLLHKTKVWNISFKMVYNMHVSYQLVLQSNHIRKSIDFCKISLLIVKD